MWADFWQGLDDAAALHRLRAFILGEAPKSGPDDDPKVPKPDQSSTISERLMLVEDFEQQFSIGSDNRNVLRSLYPQDETRLQLPLGG